MVDKLTRQEGTPYSGRRKELQRDVYSAEVDWGSTILNEDNPVPVVVEPIFTIFGSGEHKGGVFDERDEWIWGTGTNLRVARSSIPALMRVLSDLLEADVTI